jgi:hypothetical protein
MHVFITQLICGFLYAAITGLGYRPHRPLRVMNNKLERIWRDAFLL